MKVLLLNGTGFIGSPTVRALIARGHEVTVFHRGKTQPDLPTTVGHIYGEREQLGEFAGAFRAVNPDVVVDMLPIGEEDARLVVETFRGLAKRLVAIGSMDVYRAYGQINGTEDDGEPAPYPFDEEGPLRSNLYPYRSHSKSPGDFFDRYDKILVERVVMNESQLPATMLRLPAVYGPGDKQHRVGSYLKQMEEGEVKLSSMQSKWKWTRGYVENVANAIALAASDERATNRIYNVGEAEATTELEWVRAIARAAKWNGPIIVDETPTEDDASYRFHLAADTGRIRRELEYDETVSLEEALQRTAAWERTQAEQD